jgi:lipoate-protein ligase A
VSDEWRVEERTGSAAVLHDAWPAVLERPEGRALAVCHVTEAAVVLGSTQPASLVDGARASADGVAVARRRSGGGAVLVTPADPVWVDAWLPAGDPLWTDDVGRAFDWLGETWTAALGRSGINGVSAHRQGYVACTRWATSVCFGGVGTGEVVTADGRKVVGLAQRRNRHGAWFHGACYLHWDPARLVDLLTLSVLEREAALVGLGGAAVGVSDLSEQAGQGPIEGREVAVSVVAALP